MAVALIGLLLLLAWDFSRADLVVAHGFGGSHGFPLREHWLTSRVLHNGGRWVGYAAAAVLLVNIWRPWWPGCTRRERVLGALMTLLCLLAVPALKQISTTSCPWDLAEFGGVAQTVSHWNLGVSDGGPGRCFPSGHATAAFAFFGAWFMLRDSQPQVARWWLAGVLLFGLAFGWAQLARGAHFPSHTAWSAWLCWVICALMSALSRKRLPAATNGPG